MKPRNRTQRIHNIAKKIAKRSAKRNAQAGRGKPLAQAKKKPRSHSIIAYDLETTPIKRGNPEPLYLTAFGATFHYSGRINDLQHLGEILSTQFLTADKKGARFVAWNGNNFDVFLIAAALLHYPDFLIRPYLTRNKNLRGMRVYRKVFDSSGRDITLERGTHPDAWEFLDGIAMTVGVPRKLADFLRVFAPDYGKLQGPDFEHGETFDASNPDHVAYAERDSEGLYHALMQAQSIVMQHFNMPLQPTIGNLGIKIFQANIPAGIVAWEPPLDATAAIRAFVMRGGFCFCVKRYQGPIWKYDLNQAYAAAMRDAMLPAGRCIYTRVKHRYARVAIYRITATNPCGKIPFYYRDTEGTGIFDAKQITDTWVTSIELNQLEKEGWNVKVSEGYYWDDHFQMRDFVSRLEALRVHAPGGPKSAQGEMMKAIGNNSYGKTVEQLDGLELLMSLEQPEGFGEYFGPEEECLQHVWFRFTEPMMREYHRPQIGAFITAHVRMVVRRAALLAPDEWLYADTDCVVFSKPVDLPIDAGKYGYWKQETDGEEYRIIAKKVYANLTASERHAKGLNVKRMTAADFERWYNGEPPEQRQVQRQNFVAVMSGADMYIERVRRGERKKVSKNA